MKVGRIVAVIVLVVLDVLVLPVLFYLPQFVTEFGLGAAPGQLITAFLNSPLMGIRLLSHEAPFRNIWMLLQLLFLAGILSVVWHPELGLMKRRVSKDFGGPPAAGHGQFGTARWRTEKEIEKTVTVWHTKESKPLKGGVVLGARKVGNSMKVYLDTSDTHVLLLGATRSGKSRTVILPTIWTLAKTGDSMILTDPKGELYEYSAEYLKKQGYDVTLLNFREPIMGNCWNPMEPVVKFYEEGRIDKAVEAALDIAHSLVFLRVHHGDPIWELGEKSVIAGLTLAVAMEAQDKAQKHLHSVAMILANMGIFDEEDECPLNDYIASLPFHHPARSAFATSLMAAQKTRASFFAGAMAKLQLFTDPNIAYMTSKQDHDMTAPGKKPTAVFLVIPDEKSTRYVLASLYINQAYMALVDLAIKNGRKLPNPVHFLCDEFGNLPAIPDMDKKITVAGGRGIKFLLAIQSLAQLDNLYDKQAKTITGNCHTWIYLTTNDPDTAKIISEKTGKYTVQTENSNYSLTGSRLGSSAGVGLTGRALLTPDEVQRWPKNHALILQARELPARLPLPDVSEWPAYADLQMQPMSDFNRAVPPVSVWLPGTSACDEVCSTSFRPDAFFDSIDNI